MATTRTIRTRSRSILVVTSHPLAALRLQPGLRALPNCKISFVFDRVDAFLLARKEPPDLLILDYCMADINTLNLAKAFNRLYPKAEIITLATSEDNGPWQQLAEARIGSVLEKPVNPAELYQVAMAALTEPT
jgi:DNA-binding NarL/FixJ family response regulator